MIGFKTLFKKGNFTGIYVKLPENIQRKFYEIYFEKPYIFGLFSMGFHVGKYSSPNGSYGIQYIR